MSGDETDSPSQSRNKTLRRIALPWINPAITTLFEAVDTYEKAVADECLMSAAGNKPIPRIYIATKTDHNNPPVRKLPRNWYNDDWYKTRTTAYRSFLEASSAVPIPCLVSICDSDVVFQCSSSQRQNITLSDSLGRSRKVGNKMYR